MQLAGMYMFARAGGGTFGSGAAVIGQLCSHTLVILHLQFAGGLVTRAAGCLRKVGAWGKIEIDQHCVISTMCLLCLYVECGEQLRLATVVQQLQCRYCAA
jgi:hypothetical protein